MSRTLPIFRVVHKASVESLRKNIQDEMEEHLSELTLYENLDEDTIYENLTNTPDQELTPSRKPLPSPRVNNSVATSLQINKSQSLLSIDQLSYMRATWAFENVYSEPNDLNEKVTVNIPPDLPPRPPPDLPARLTQVVREAKKGLQYENLEVPKKTTAVDIKAMSVQFKNSIKKLKETEIEYLEVLTDVVPIFSYVVKHHNAPKTRQMLMKSALEKLLPIQVAFRNDLIGNTTFEGALKTFSNYDHMLIVYQELFMASHGGGLVVSVSENQGGFEKDINLGEILSQRLKYYKLFLDDIVKELQRDPLLLPAVMYPLQIINEILDLCAKKSIPLRIQEAGNMACFTPMRKDEPINVLSYGDYLLKDKFKVETLKSKEVTAFLFSNVLLFTKEVKKDLFRYQGQVNMNDAYLLPERKKNSKKLVIVDYTQSKRFGRDVFYELKAGDKEVQKRWSCKIKDLLWEQMTNKKPHQRNTTC